MASQLPNWFQAEIFLESHCGHGSITDDSTDFCPNHHPQSFIKILPYVAKKLSGLFRSIFWPRQESDHCKTHFCNPAGHFQPNLVRPLACTQSMNASSSTQVGFREYEVALVTRYSQKFNLKLN